MGSIRPTAAHVPALDGVRGAAAATVFIYHYGGGAQSSDLAIHFVGETIHLGWAGVSLFFVLSGFLITGILLDSMGQETWWRRFYIRRTLRIFPLYYFAICAVVVVNILLGRSWPSVLPIWPLFFYLQDFPGVVKFELLGPHFNLGHLWSLAVEEQFYLVWPLLLLLTRKRDLVRQLAVAIFFASLLFRVAIFGCHINSEWATYFIGGRAGEMAVGGFLAAFLRTPEAETLPVVRNARRVLIASAVCLVVLIFLSKQTDARDAWMGTLGISLFSLLSGALILLCLQPGTTQRFFSLRILRWLGKISYGIYVYHVLLYPVFLRLTSRLLPSVTGRWYDVAVAAVATVGTLSAAALSFATLESGFLRLKDSLGGRNSRPADAT
jgi:peptidoglycan/LPS O-acetylase OafA/YrhL